MQSPPDTNVATIIALWPTTEAFADDIGLKRRGDHARVMKARGRIPKHHWPKILEAAKERGLPLTEQALEAANRSGGAQ